MVTRLEPADTEQLPDLYQRWVEELLPAGIPRERSATCLDCAMCPGEGAVIDGGPGFFNPASKCCTYFPTLPNFLAGRAIANDNPGAAALRAIIEEDRPGGAVASATLRGVQPGAYTATLYAHHHDAIFGRDAAMICPYAIEADTPEGPLCGIWKQRNAVCSTWFCKHTKGATGVTFWRALQGLLSQLELSLSWWAIAQVLPEPTRALSLTPYAVNRPIEVALRGDAWSLWGGSRAAFYEACADAVDGLSAAEAIEVAGLESRLLQWELGTRYGELRSTAPPERLRAAPFTLIGQDGARATLVTEACKEAFEAPAVLLGLLHHFDGRPTEEVIASIRVSSKIRLEPGLVRRLYDFGVLERVPAVP